MESGAGSSGVSALPSFPTADSTSASAVIALPCMASTSCTSEIPAWGMVDGIYKNEPSLSGGINSLPSPGKL